MSLLDALVFRPVLLAIHAADIFTQSFSVAGLIPSGLTLSSGPSKHKIPKHVAFSLVISDQGKLGELKRRSRHEAGRQGRNNVPKPQESQSPSGNKGKEKETCEQAEYKEELSALESQALLSTVQQVVRWAAARDISEISIWNEDGKRELDIFFGGFTDRLLDKYLESLVSLLAERPPTPPASGTSSPPPYNRQRGQNRPRQPADSHTAFPANTPTGVSSPDVQSSWIRVDPPLLTETESQFLLHTQDADEALDNFTASRSFTVWPDLENIMEGYDTCKLSSSSSLSRLPSSETTGSLLTDTTARKPVNVHVLARDAGDPMMAHITKKLIADGVPSERVSQQIVEQMVQDGDAPRSATTARVPILATPRDGDIPIPGQQSYTK
ncbi:hypothetical protein QFC19_001060 [Naganishia cerealis]|uniref:Uncharacterized protein n=1 Tax=Naganishia cerealis TaxID=610337 RepID=A0ACC2WIX7_9TREE|nr:hypothetical protein QFC19_001060 [Naganishia cerealis]